MITVCRVVRVVGGLAATTAVVFAAGCSSGSKAPDPAPTGTSSQAASNAPAAGVRHLDPAAFAAAVEQSGTVLLDVRTPAEFAAGHLAKATNVDVQAADFGTRIAALDKAASYALYCRSGVRSGQAAGRMRAAGFANVVDLAGGITAWTAAGKPVTTG